jgi:hypothetical protein
VPLPPGTNSFAVKIIIIIIIKGKAVPLHAWTSPEVSRRFRLPDF